MINRGTATDIEHPNEEALRNHEQSKRRTMSKENVPWRILGQNVGRILKGRNLADLQNTIRHEVLDEQVAKLNVFRTSSRTHAGSYALANRRIRMYEQPEALAEPCLLHEVA